MKRKYVWKKNVSRFLSHLNWDWSRNEIFLLTNNFMCVVRAETISHRFLLSKICRFIYYFFSRISCSIFNLIVNSVKNNFTHDSTLLAFPFTSHALFDKWDFNFLSFHTQIPVIPFVFYKKRADFLHPKIEFQGTYTLK